MAMRYLLLVAAPVMLFGQAAGVVEGTVIDAFSRTPVASANVNVQKVPSRDGRVYSATTDARGFFHIEGIREEGAFLAGAGGQGFMPVSKPFHLSAADGPVSLQLELIAMPKLRGRVLDGDGHPVAGATVQLVRSGGGGRPSSATDQDGAFSFPDTLPTSAMLRAIPPPKLKPPQAPEDEPEVWAPTYYPDVTEQFRAQLVTLRAGDEVRYDIKLAAVRVYHVSGTVVDDSGKPVAGASLRLISPDSLDARSHAASETPEAHATSSDDGAFDFPKARPGEWYLLAAGKRDGQVLNGVVSGAVSQGNWSNIKVHVTAPFTVKGTVERPDAKPGSSPRHTWVGLLPGWSVRQMGIHNESGVFEIEEVVPGKYEVLLEEPLPGSYVDQVEYGGRDVMGQTIDVTDPALRLRVVYRTNGGTVQGTVDGCNRGTVVLLPKEPALQNTQFMRWGRCNASGHFDIGNLRPGSYYAAAFEELEFSDLAYGLYYGGVVDPALVAGMIQQGAGVKVEAGQTATPTLTLTGWPGK